LGGKIKSKRDGAGAVADFGEAFGGALAGAAGSRTPAIVAARPRAG